MEGKNSWEKKPQLINIQGTGAEGTRDKKPRGKRCWDPRERGWEREKMVFVKHCDGETLGEAACDSDLHIMFNNSKGTKRQNQPSI